MEHGLGDPQLWSKHIPISYSALKLQANYLTYLGLNFFTYRMWKLN